MGILIDLIKSIYEACVIIGGIVITICIAYVIAKMCYIWRDTMLERNERIKNDIVKLNKLKHGNNTKGQKDS